MKLLAYLKDQLVSCFLVLFFTSLQVVVLWAFDCPLFLIIYMPMLTLGLFVMIFLYNYWRKHQYYNLFLATLNHLQKKYLISELVKAPHFLEGQLMSECVYQINKATMEHINEMLFRQNEFKEYIEMWCHEIKLPVATSEMIIENNLNAVTESLKEELTKVDNYIEQVLFYARSESVEKDYLIKEICLKEIVNEVIKRNKKDLISNHFQIIIDDLNHTIPSDKKWLEFIINQIVSNSIKYCQDSPCLHFYSEAKQECVILYIEDNGIGILESEIERVFDQGFTGSLGRHYKKSTGIGLYLCKKLCQRLHHDISVSSHQGTCVKLIFPKSSFVDLGD